MTANQINTAMIFAAGLGTRLKPWTDLHPKALAGVNGKPLLQRNIEYLRRFGIDRLVINVHHFADKKAFHSCAAKTPALPCLFP